MKPHIGSEVNQRRKLDAKAHRAIFVGYPRGVKGYKLYDLEKKKFIVSRNVQFFEENFDHSDEKVKSDDAGQADLKFIYPDMNQENESVPVPLLPEAPQVQDNVKSMLNSHLCRMLKQWEHLPERAWVKKNQLEEHMKMHLWKKSET